MQITPITNGDRRQTGNRAWPAGGTGVIGTDIAATALALKGLIQRDMASRTVTEANRLCDAIVAQAERVEGLEHTVLVGGCHGQE